MVFPPFLPLSLLLLPCFPLPALLFFLCPLHFPPLSLPILLPLQNCFYISRYIIMYHLISLLNQQLIVCWLFACPSLKSFSIPDLSFKVIYYVFGFFFFFCTNTVIWWMIRNFVIVHKKSYNHNSEC